MNRRQKGRESVRTSQRMRLTEGNLMPDAELRDWDLWEPNLPGGTGRNGAPSQPPPATLPRP